MTQAQNTTAISIMHPICCGLDVHRMKISACLITIDSDGNEQSELKEFLITYKTQPYFRGGSLCDTSGVLPYLQN